MFDIPKKVIFAQLIAVGSTVKQDVAQYKHLTFAYVVAAIGTSVNVQAQGSMDGTNWFNLNDGRVDTQETANGTFMLRKSNFKCQFVRFTLVSEVGAAVTIDVTLMLGN